MIEEIRIARFAGMGVIDDDRAGEKDVTVLALEKSDGKQIAVFIPREQAFEAVIALMSGLASAAAGSTSYRHVMGTSGWQVEPAAGGGAVLHALLANTEGARLSFDLCREHARPLAEQLRMLADHPDAQSPAPTAPSSSARN